MQRSCRSTRESRSLDNFEDHVHGHRRSGRDDAGPLDVVDLCTFDPAHRFQHPRHAAGAAAAGHSVDLEVVHGHGVTWGATRIRLPNAVGATSAG